MKIGIDINNRDISRAVKKELKEKGYYVVDMSLEEKNIGEKLFKKVLLINSSKLEFFLSLEILVGNGSIDIYYKEENSKKFSEKMIESIKDIGIKKITLNDGKDFYLIKNSKVPTVIIKLNIEDEIKDKEKILVDSIIESIKDIDGIF